KRSPTRSIIFTPLRFNIYGVGNTESDNSALFFFFQAEDGIRDRTVTGVQTCALPIYWQRWRMRSKGQKLRRPARPAGPGGHRRRAARAGEGSWRPILYRLPGRAARAE